MAKRKKQQPTDDVSDLPIMLADRDNKPVITVDYALYEKYLEGEDLTDDQKREFLQGLWTIIVEFIDLGFGVHPLQQAKDSCGQEQETVFQPPSLIRNDGKLFDKSFIQQFADADAGEPKSSLKKEFSQ